MCRKNVLKKDKNEAEKAILEQQDGLAARAAVLLVAAQGSRIAASPSGHMAARARRHSVYHSQGHNAYPLKRTDFLSVALLAHLRSTRACICQLERTLPLAWIMFGAWKGGSKWEEGTASSPIIMV